MSAVSAVTFVTLLSLVIAQNVGSNIIDDKTNTIDTKPSVRLDPYIRKALLKALTELEQSDSFTTEIESTDGTGSTTGSEILSTSEAITETLQTPLPEDKIQIHSFIVNGQTAFDNKTETIPTYIDNKISILSTTTGNVEDQVTATLPTQLSFNDILQTRETSTNVQQVRSIQNTVKSVSENTIVNEVSKVKVSTNASPTTAAVTTTTTTTTTTPKPTHNDDGENIEEVSHRDVQVFQAPLVAAFTVHQDAQGVPKRVVPIYQQTRDQVKPVPSSQGIQNNIPVINTQPGNTQGIHNNIPVINTQPSNKISQTTYITQQLLLQKQLEDKQKYLEEQLRQLQNQQRHQEELLRKQQIILQQKEAQKQNQIQNQQNVFRQPATQISVVPSVSLGLDQSSALNNQQQLPNREAVDFLLHLRTQHREQFPLQENHLPQGLSNFLQPGNFHQGPNFNQIRTIEDQFRGKQGNRVFRHESGVGNFGFNNQNFNRYNTLGQFQANRFGPQHRPHQFSNDAELQQLLVQTGLNGRTQEDLNIVSKVLSLNHGIPFNNNLSNRQPFDSRRHVRNS